jgi:hypothetical protein
MKLSTIIKQKKAELKRVSPRQRDRARQRLKVFQVLQALRKEKAA